MQPSRFVILEHHHQGIHYDLMVEAGPVLRTWRLRQPLEANSVQEAIRAFDHRIVYLDYEGPISGGRGHVKRWDSGTFEGDPAGDAHLCLQVHGNRLQGTLTLQAIEADRWEVGFSTNR